jgi:hypothetical protein
MLRFGGINRRERHCGIDDRNLSRSVICLVRSGECRKPSDRDGLRIRDSQLMTYICCNYKGVVNIMALIGQVSRCLPVSVTEPVSVK